MGKGILVSWGRKEIGGEFRRVWLVQSIETVEWKIYETMTTFLALED